MTIEERMNLQKGKEIPKRLQTASNNSENEAIEREKKLKRYRRIQKLNLINAFNPEWNDLYNSLS